MFEKINFDTDGERIVKKQFVSRKIQVPEKLSNSSLCFLNVILIT